MSFRGPARATCKCGWVITCESFIKAGFAVQRHQAEGCDYWGKRYAQGWYRNPGEQKQQKANEQKSFKF